MDDLRSHFGFHQTPFTRELLVEHRFTLPIFDEPLIALKRAVDTRSSAALIAPSGTGKSTVLRALAAQLPEARYRVHYVKVTDLCKRHMCYEIATAIGAKPTGTYPALVRAIQERFTALADTDAVRPVLLLDEAHDLRPDVLGMLRLLTNFEMDSRLVVSIILAGQPPLREMLRHERLEDFARRLAHYAVLRPLSRAETQRYLEHRCTIAGAVTVPFDAAAIDAIYEISRGNLRAIDQLALKTLELACTLDRKIVDAVLIVEARKVLWP
jgi:type II secretory pathway predicted ATPase ExeA